MCHPSSCIFNYFVELVYKEIDAGNQVNAFTILLSREKNEKASNWKFIGVFVMLNNGSQKVYTLSPPHHNHIP